MFVKSIYDLTEKDLQEMVDRICERTVLDFKLILKHKDSKEEKGEFLADVCSFANSQGGWLFYGISEEEGVAKEIIGIDIEDADKQRTEIENMIGDLIEPRIQGIETATIPLANGKKVLVIQVPKSWRDPHRIKGSKEVARESIRNCYSRNSTGKYPMGWDDIKTAFLRSTGIYEKAEKFVENRISNLADPHSTLGNPVACMDAFVVLHLIPLTSLVTEKVYDVRACYNEHSGLCVPLDKEKGYTYDYNYRGVIYTDGKKDAYGHSYNSVQFYREGIVEACSATLVVKEKKYISLKPFEEKMIDGVSRYICVYRQLNIPFPVFLSLSLIKIKGYSLWTGDESAGRSGPLEETDLFMPNLIMERDREDVPKLLRPWFDCLYNAFGCPGSPSYNENGEYVFS